MRQISDLRIKTDFQVRGRFASVPNFLLIVRLLSEIRKENALTYPPKWRETENPFRLPYQNFTLTKILGYPHAGNDVFHAVGVFREKEVEVFIKVARQQGADIQNEIRTIRAIRSPLLPEIIDCDPDESRFVVTLAKKGERLSVILKENPDESSFYYLYEYGQILARFHSLQGEFSKVKDRKFFHIPPESYFQSTPFPFVFDYLCQHRPARINFCFCHGDFHYANILWENRKISAVLDFELSGIGNREFDIAWAVIRRPGQNFLKTEQELELFLKGYRSVSECNLEYVRYYMVLIYSYFYQIGSDQPDYQAALFRFFRQYCLGENTQTS